MSFVCLRICISVAISINCMVSCQFRSFFLRWYKYENVVIDACSRVLSRHYLIVWVSFLLKPIVERSILEVPVPLHGIEIEHLDTSSIYMISHVKPLYITGVELLMRCLTNICFLFSNVYWFWILISVTKLVYLMTWSVYVVYIYDIQQMMR